MPHRQPLLDTPVHLPWRSVHCVHYVFSLKWICIFVHLPSHVSKNQTIRFKSGVSNVRPANRIFPGPRDDFAKSKNNWQFFSERNCCFKCARRGDAIVFRLRKPAVNSRAGRVGPSQPPRSYDVFLPTLLRSSFPPSQPQNGCRVQSAELQQHNQRKTKKTRSRRDYELLPVP